MEQIRTVVQINDDLEKTVSLELSVKNYIDMRFDCRTDGEKVNRMDSTKIKMT